MSRTNTKRTLDIMKVRPEFKKCFKLSAMKQGFPTIASYSEYLAQQIAQGDQDFAQIMNAVRKKRGERFFEI